MQHPLRRLLLNGGSWQLGAEQRVGLGYGRAIMRLARASRRAASGSCGAKRPVPHKAPSRQSATLRWREAKYILIPHAGCAPMMERTPHDLQSCT